MKLIIGIVGTSGSGKTTAAKYFKRKKFYSITLSSYIQKVAEKQGYKNVPKKVLQEVGNDLRTKYGSDFLVKKAYKEVIDKGITKVIIDGIRNIGEIAYLKKIKNFYLLGVDADPKIRYKRIKNLRGDKWLGKYADFLAIEKRENNLGDKKSGLRVSECLALCNEVILNNSSLVKFYKRLDKYI